MNKSFNHIFNYITYISITFYYLLNFVIELNEAKFQKIKKLSSSGDYFIILDNGLFIYNSDFTEKTTIYSFNNNQKISSNEDSTNTIITELKNNDDTYIICLAKKYVYLYDDSNKKIYNYYLSKLSEEDYSQSGVIYNLMPYNIQNNIIYFIISFIREKLAAHKIIFLYYNFNYIENTLNLAEKTYTGTDSFLGTSGISPFFVSCQIYAYPSYIMQCIYSSEYRQYFSSIYFNLNINKAQDANQFVIKTTKKNFILTIKSSISYDNNIFLSFLGSNSLSYIFINNTDYSFKEISCAPNYNCEDLETYYFSETNEFVLICRKNNEFNLLRFNSKLSQALKTNNCNNNIIEKKLSIKDCDSINIYSIIYNDTINDYNIISDCNFTNNPQTETYKTEDLKNPEIENEKDTSNTSNESDKKTENENSEKIININDLIIFPSSNINNLNNNNYSNNITLNLNKEDLEIVIKGYKDGNLINDTLLKNDIDKLGDEKEKLFEIIEKSNITKNLTIDNVINIIENALIYSPCELNINDNIKLNITSSNTNISKNSTRIDLFECENILKKHYNFSNTSFLKTVVMSIDTNNPNSLHDQVEYKVYNDKNEELDLSLCKNEKIRVYYSINKNSSLDFDLIQYYIEQNINVLNTKDSFFNDICYPYSESGDDIILGDRRNDIYQNYSLCDSGCTFNNIDYENMVIACDCEIKENITTEIEPLKYEEFEDVSLMDSNIGVIICYQLVFSFKGKLNNIGFWILSFLLVGNMIPLICFFYHGIKSIMEYVFYEMVKYGYLKNNHEIFFEKKNNSKINTNNKKQMNIKGKKKKKKKKKNISNPVKNSKIKKKLNKKNILIKNAKIININLTQDGQGSFSIQKINDNTKPILKELTKTNNDKLKKPCKYKNKKINNLSYLPTEDIKQNKNNKNDKNDIYYGIIKLDLNNININKYIPKDSNETLYNYTYKEAITYDKRSIFKIFYIYLLSKQIIFHTFFLKSPLELFSLRLCLFIFMISTDLALNALLYLNDNISKKYKYSKNLFLFTFSDNITVIIYSTLLCFVLMTLICKLGSCANSIREVFIKEEEKIINDKKYKIDSKRKNEIFIEIEKILKKFKIKIVFLIIIQIVLMLFFWYFVTAFCHVYNSTQKSWLLDSGFSMLSRWVIELLFALLFSKLYLISIESNIYTLYRVILFIYGFR